MRKFEGYNIEKIKAELETLEGRIKRLERSDNFIEAKYEALLSERVFLNGRLEQIDEVIKSAVRRQKHPAREEYKLEGNVKVILEYKNMFLSESDAMVSAIHVEKGFVPTEKTATLEFINRVEDNELAKFKNHKPKTPGSFVALNHPTLSAPMSYHILYYRDGAKELGLDILDLDVLEEGIISALEDAKEKWLKTISFFPLGFDYINQFHVEEEKKCKSIKDKEERAKQLRIRGDAAIMLADRMAETIVQYFVKNPKTSIKTIYFGFVSYKTMRTMDKAFNKWGQSPNKNSSFKMNYLEFKKILLHRTIQKMKSSKKF